MSYFTFPPFLTSSSSQPNTPRPSSPLPEPLPDALAMPFPFSFPLTAVGVREVVERGGDRGERERGERGAVVLVVEGAAAEERAKDLYERHFPLDARLAECVRLWARHPGAIPVVVVGGGSSGRSGGRSGSGGSRYHHHHQQQQHYQQQRHTLALPPSAVLADLAAAVRLRADLPPRQPLAFSVDGCAPAALATAAIGDLYAACAREDGFLHVHYSVARRHHQQQQEQQDQQEQEQQQQHPWMTETEAETETETEGAVIEPPAVMENGGCEAEGLTLSSSLSSLSEADPFWPSRAPSSELLAGAAAEWGGDTHQPNGGAFHQD